MHAFAWADTRGRPLLSLLHAYPSNGEAGRWGQLGRRERRHALQCSGRLGEAGGSSLLPPPPLSLNLDFFSLPTPCLCLPLPACLACLAHHKLHTPTSFNLIMAKPLLSYINHNLLPPVKKPLSFFSCAMHANLPSPALFAALCTHTHSSMHLLPCMEAGLGAVLPAKLCPLKRLEMAKPPPKPGSHTGRHTHSAACLFGSGKPDLSLGAEVEERKQAGEQLWLPGWMTILQWMEVGWADLLISLSPCLPNGRRQRSLLS